MDKLKKKKRMQAMFLVAAVLIMWNIIQLINPEKTVRIACVGDSITYGAWVEDREKNCYPVVLQNLLGTDGYRVGNFGVNGATLQKSGDKPYWKQERYEQSLSYEADIVVIMLGTNDTKSVNWKNSDAFRKDYLSLIESYASLDTRPQIILVTPPSLFQIDETGQGTKAGADAVIAEESRVIHEIGEEKKLTVIDLYEMSGTHPEWFNEDGIHPNAKGAAAIAEAVAGQVQESMKEDRTAAERKMPLT